jgi:hypothetical protein
MAKISQKIKKQQLKNGRSTCDKAMHGSLISVATITRCWSFPGNSYHKSKQHTPESGLFTSPHAVGVLAEETYEFLDHLYYSNSVFVLAWNLLYFQSQTERKTTHPMKPARGKSSVPTKRLRQVKCDPLLCMASSCRRSTDAVTYSWI